MKASPLPHQTARISDSVHRQLNAYALAAGAAGVGTLCFAKPAAARVVYTPAHVAIKVNGGLFHIDLNHDGIPDFGLNNSWYQGEKSYRVLLIVPSQPGNGVSSIKVTCFGSSVPVAAALPKGKKIGPTGRFSSNRYGALMAGPGGSGGTGSCGAWDGQSHLQAYLGLKFAIKGETHFGWARVKVDTLQQQRPFLETLTGYAYETIPNKPILAGQTKGLDAVPEPSTLGDLAGGASKPHKVPTRSIR